MLRNLIASTTYRLYDVSEISDEHGHYCLGAFADTAFNEDVAEEALDETLCQLADVLFGQSGCRWFEITDDVETAENGTLCIDLGDNDWLEVRDIVDKIDVDPEESQLYVMVNASRTEHYWVAALPAAPVCSA